MEYYDRRLGKVTDKERLEEAKENFEIGLINNGEIRWLIQQAEKVEQLEKKLAETNNCIICGDDGSKVIDNAVYCKYC